MRSHGTSGRDKIYQLRKKAAATSIELHYLLVGNRYQPKFWLSTTKFSLQVSCCSVYTEFTKKLATFGCQHRCIRDLRLFHCISNSPYAGIRFMCLTSSQATEIFLGIKSGLKHYISLSL